MRILATTFLLFALNSVGTPAMAMEPFVVYDFFSGDRIDPALWNATHIGEATLDAVREVSAGHLRLSNRSYGDRTVTGGRTKHNVGIRFEDSNAVTQIAAFFKPIKLDLVGCSLDTGTSTQAEVRIAGYWFNDGSSTGLGDATGDMWLQLQLSRNTDSTDPAGVMRVNANVFRCGDPGCSGDGGSDVFVDNTSLGTVTVGDLVLLGVIWEAGADRFIFFRSGAAPLVYSYAGIVASDSDPPGSQSGKQINNRVRPENCQAAPDPMGMLEVHVLFPLVNSSAVLGP